MYQVEFLIVINYLYLLVSTCNSTSVNHSQIGSNSTSSPLTPEPKLLSILSNITVNLPGEVFKSNTQNLTGLVFTVYSNSSLFPLDDTLKRNHLIVGTPIVGATVANESISNLSQRVVVTLPILVDFEVSICV